LSQAEIREIVAELKVIILETLQIFESPKERPTCKDVIRKKLGDAKP
jgi:hypothetical protein